MMKTHGDHRWHPIAARFRARLSRRAVVHAAGLVGMAGMLLVSLPRPAHSAPVVWETLDFVQLQCMDETGDEGGGVVNRFRERRNSDEPYVVLVAADISARSHRDPRFRLPR